MTEPRSVVLAASKQRGIIALLKEEFSVGFWDFIEESLDEKPKDVQATVSGATESAYGMF